MARGRKPSAEVIKLFEEYQRALFQDNPDLVEEFYKIHGRFPKGYTEASDARLQAAAEQIQQDVIGSANPKFRKRDDRYVFDDDYRDDKLNTVERALARIAPTSPVTFVPGPAGQKMAIQGGNINSLGTTSGYLDANDAFGAPQQELSHINLDLSNPAHRAVATGEITEDIPLDQAREALTIREAMMADDHAMYSAALKRRDVPAEYAYQFLDRFKREKLSKDGNNGGPRKTGKVMDYIKASGNSGRDDIHLNAQGVPIMMLKADQTPEGKARMSQMLADRGASLSKQLVDTGFRSAMDPTPGMEIPGQTLEMDHASPQSLVGPAFADEPTNRTFLHRVTNGQTKNDRTLAQTLDLTAMGALIKAQGMQPVDARKLEGDELVTQLYTDSRQTNEFGRLLTKKMAHDRNAEYLEQATAALNKMRLAAA